MSLLGIFCIVFEPGFGSRLLGLAELYFDLALLTALLLAIDRLSPKSASALRILLYAVFYAVALVDVACYVRLQSSISPLWIEVTLMTNRQEAREALSSFLGADLLFSKVGVLLLLIAANMGVVIYGKPLARRLRPMLPVLPPLGRRLAVGTLAALWLGCGALTLEEKEYFLYKTLLQHDELEVQQIKELEPKAGNYLPVYRLAYSLSEYGRMQDARRGLANSADKVVIDSCTFTSPHIVLIIGESCNRRHTSLYGYAKPTTPRQRQMEERGELVRFDDVVSSWNVTCESLQYMFSLYGKGDEGAWYDYPLFTQFLKQAGYDNLLLSNQYVMDKGKSMSRYKEDVFINSPRLSQTQFARRNTERHTYDEGLIDDFRRLFRPTSEHTFTVFHFLGLHFGFEARYPAEFTTFEPADYERPDLDPEQRQTLAHYDNAMRYNDYVISRIIDLFREGESVVLFVPDHGERIFDGGTTWGRSLTWDSSDVCQQFDIPFWIWGSDSYRERHADLWAAIGEAAGRRFMTDNLPHLILHLAGLSTPYYKPQNDPLSPAYDEQRPRILRDERDYDDIRNQP